MSKQIFTLLLLGILSSVSKSEPPPPAQYGAPFQGPTGAPITNYEAPNYNNNNHHHNNYNNNNGYDGNAHNHNNYDNGHGHHNYDSNGHDHSEPKSYEFGYQVKDDYTGTNYKRQEQSDGNQVTGEYRVALPDGRTQIVTYYADWQSGFHADVRYEGEAHYPETYKTYNNNNGGYNNNAQMVNNALGYNDNNYNNQNYNNYNNQGYNNNNYHHNQNYNQDGYNNNNYNNYQGGYNNGYNINNGYANGYNNNYNNNGYSGATASVSIKDISPASTPFSSGNNYNNNNNYEYNAASGYNYPSPDYGNKVRRSTEKDEKLKKIDEEEKKEVKKDTK